MSDALVGTGILLKAGDGATPTENFVAVAEIVSLKIPAFSRNEIDVSNHNEGREAKILGMLRQGQVTGTCNWLPTDPTQSSAAGGLLADIRANVKRNWRIELPPTGFPQWTMPARVQLFDPPEVTVDAALQIAFALTVDGDIDVVEEEET